MTVSEIFSSLAEHLIKGMMTHEQFANYYKFLGLSGYAKCHEYHFMKETCAYRKLQRYYICHYNKLIPETEFSNPSVIPESWYGYTRQDVDSSTKKSGVKNGLIAWVEWEEETKKLYEQMYKELMELGEVASAQFLSEYVADVSCELMKAQGYLLNKSATGFDIGDIMSEQKHKHEKYKKCLTDMCYES